MTGLRLHRVVAVTEATRQMASRSALSVCIQNIGPYSAPRVMPSLRIREKGICFEYACLSLALKCSVCQLQLDDPERVLRFAALPLGLIHLDPSPRSACAEI